MTKHAPRTGAPAVDRDGGLVVEARPWARGVVLALYGELDLDSRTDLRSAVEGVLAGPVAVIVIDCAGLEFCDSTGLDALLRAKARAAAGGTLIELARAGPLVLRTLELTGAADTFRIRGTVPD